MSMVGSLWSDVSWCVCVQPEFLIYPRPSHTLLDRDGVQAVQAGRDHEGGRPVPLKYTGHLQLLEGGAEAAAEAGVGLAGGGLLGPETSCGSRSARAGTACPHLPLQPLSISGTVPFSSTPHTHAYTHTHTHTRTHGT